MAYKNLYLQMKLHAADPSFVLPPDISTMYPLNPVNSLPVVVRAQATGYNQQPIAGTGPTALGEDSLILEVSTPVLTGTYTMLVMNYLAKMAVADVAQAKLSDFGTTNWMDVQVSEVLSKLRMGGFEVHFRIAALISAYSATL
jgi:hypothetical protein